MSCLPLPAIWTSADLAHSFTLEREHFFWEKKLWSAKNSNRGSTYGGISESGGNFSPSVIDFTFSLMSMPRAFLISDSQEVKISAHPCPSSSATFGIMTPSKQRT